MGMDNFPAIQNGGETILLGYAVCHAGVGDWT